MAYDPTNGETPLAELPKYGGYGGDVESGKFYAGQKFAELFGRNPTASELTMFAPAYVGGNGRIANTAQGDQAIAQYFQSMSNTPDQINKGNNEKYLKEAPKHFDAVNQLFQSHLGRTATQEELNHFGSLLASGTTDQYGLQEFLQQQPEYTNKQNQGFQDKLAGQLAGYDKQYFNESILPSLQEAYAKQGRSFDSSSFQAAATNSAQQQNVGRQQFLGNLSAQQYGGVQDRAYQDYANQVANQQNLTNQGIQARYTGNQATMGRLNEITDFNTQSQLYNQYIARFGRRNNNGVGSLVGGVAGAAFGFTPVGRATGGPQAWGQLGSGLGQAGQNAAGGSY